MTLLPEAERRGDRSAHWRSEPCPAELPISDPHAALSGGRSGMTFTTFTCQRPQQWNGPLQRAHLVHMWRGVIDGRKVEITWSGGDEP